MKKRVLTSTLTLGLSIHLVSAKSPNIILFLIDDLGWTDTSVPMIEGDPKTMSDFYQTPNLERMAKSGMVFSQAYAAAPVSTPSRTSIQYGKTPARLQNTTVYDILAITRNKRCQGEVSIHEMIKRSNPEYVTAHFGKWGLDVRSETGYDYSDGNTNNIDGDWAVRNKERYPDSDPKGIYSLTERANNLIEMCATEDKPFFLQVSHYAAHVDNFARSAMVDKYKSLPPGEKCIPADYEDGALHINDGIMNYAAMLDDLDTSIGMVLDRLEELGIDDNTYIIYTSDNGGDFRGNDPLSGQKATLWEGGIRVPMFVVGPKVKRGAYCTTPVAGWDFYATINDIVGGEPLDDTYDGGSLVNLFEKGDRGVVERTTKELYFHYPWYGGTMPASAIIDNNYKLVKNLHTGESRLFNLDDDIGEVKDLSLQDPKMKKRLLDKLNSYMSMVDAEDINDMFDVRLRELQQRMKTTKEAGDKEQYENNLRQYETIKEASKNKSWRYR